MTDAVLTGALGTAQRRKRASAWYVFLALVSAASLFPMVAYPLATLVIPKDASVTAALGILAFVGAHFHVGLTAWFYTDPVMRSHFSAHPNRYFFVPILLVGGMAALFALVDLSVARYVVVPYLVWQMWHYQKQNVGLLSFIAAGTDRTPLSAWERRTFAVAAVSGILGFLHLGGSKLGVPDLPDVYLRLHQVGLAVACLLPVGFVAALTQSKSLRTNRMRLAFFLFGTVFFLPIYLFDDPIAAITGYAIAHGLQYVVFMAFVGIDKRHPIPSLIVLAGIGAIYGALALWLLDNAAVYGNGLFGAFVGLVMVHFVLDGGIWRLREPFQRGYMREKFSFVFGR